MRYGPLLLVALGVSAAAPHATASPSSRLVYSRGDGGEQCPDESALRKAVASRVGYDPFFPWAPVTVTAEVRGVGGKLRGRVTLIDAAGRQRGARELEAGTNDCAELISSVALAISIALDSLQADAKPEDPPPAPPPPAPADDAPVVSAAATPVASPDDAAEQPTPAPPADAPRGLRGFATLGGQGSLGTAPALAAGGTLGVGFRVERFGLGLEGRYDLPASTRHASGGVRAQLTTVALVPCGHLGVAFLCARVAVGSLSAEGVDVLPARSDSAPYAAVGGRLGVELPVTGPLELRAYADLDFPLSRATLQLAATDVWTAPPVAVAAGIAAVVRFP